MDRPNPLPRTLPPMRPILPLLLLLTLLPAGAPADPTPGDQDAVRRAVLEGRFRPLAEVMAEVSRVFPGRIIEMELEEEEGRMVYEFDIMTPEGRLIEVDTDAMTGAILGMEEEDG